MSDTREKISCIIAAAGRGVRFGREMPKSFYPVEGRPLLAWSLRALGAWGRIADYVVMVPPGWEAEAARELAEEAPGAPVRVLAGGETRQESVAIGIESIEGADLVLVHDACRPIVSVQLIERVAAAAREHGAAVPALQVVDTSGAQGRRPRGNRPARSRRRDRRRPQAFRYDVLSKALRASGEAARTATDESSLVLQAGHHVKVVDGEVWNIKVTVKEDLEIMGSFLSGRRLEISPRADQ